MRLNDQIIGARITALRTAVGIPRRELAEHLGVSQQQVQKYEKGQNQISAVKLAKVAKALNIPLSEFYRDELWEKTCPPRQLELYRVFNKLPIKLQPTVIALVRQIAGCH